MPTPSLPAENPAGSRPAGRLFAAVLVLYALTAYGGIRSPDGEAVYRVAESLALHGSFAVEEELDWRGFGLARGRDGRLYSVFGPLQSLAEAPFVAGANAILGERSDAGGRVPFGPSFHVGDGLPAAVRGERPTVPRPHALRFAASWATVLAAAASVLVFFRLARRCGRSDRSALVAALLYGLGSLAWWYAGSDFSEPLATLLALLSLDLLTRSDRRLVGPPRPDASAVAGLALGLSILAHVTSVLFVPLFALYAGARSRTTGPTLRGGVARLLRFAGGLAVPLAALALYNAARFGSPFETGRAVDPAAAAALGYGRFVAPWAGLHGLLLSSGKGVLLYCPAVLLGVVAWPALRRRHRILADVLAGSVLTRLFFVAARSDWHGGFALGPRLLVPTIPFLLLPVAAWLAEGGGERFRLVAGVTLACVAQQLYFALAEVFGFLHLTNTANADFDWRVSPLLHLWQARPAPWWLSGHFVPLVWLWLGAAVILLPGLAWLLGRLRGEAG